MAKSLHERASDIASSVWLGAASRIGVPLILAFVAWGGATVLALDTRLHRTESSAIEIARRVTTLEEYRERDRIETAARASQLTEIATTIRSDLSALRAAQESALRAISRVEQQIDRRSGN